MAEEPIYLKDGTKVFKLEANIDRDYRKTTIDHPIIDGVEVHLFRSYGPYVIFQKGSERLLTTQVEYDRSWSVHLVDGSNPNDYTSETHIDFSDQTLSITGWSWDSLERAEWKGCPLPSVKPSDVKEYIKKFLAKKNELAQGI